MLPSYRLIKAIYTSSASRSIYKFKARRKLYWKAPNLSCYKKWNAGRNDQGRRIIRTKASLLHKVKSVQINYNFKIKKASFISNFLFVPYRNKLLSLVRYAHGALAYYITTESHKLLSFFYFRCFGKFNRKYVISSFARLSTLPNLSFVSLIEIVNGRGAQYCRSSGTLAKILKYDRKKNMTLIKLPSGRSKLFSVYSMVSLGRVLFKENRKFSNSKAGYWRGFGFKPIVRGVAMNPVDHPHGGRTNSIRYPKTPWGKTTKYK